MKDHEIAQIVNQLRDIAVEFHDKGQLRERIAHVIVPILQDYEYVKKQLEYEWEQQAGEDC